MSELYRKLNGSETGLGDLILKAYDNTSSLLASRRAEFREYDPNAQVKDPMQFTLSGSDGDKLKLASLHGQGYCAGFLGHLVHPLPRPASALRRGEGEIQGLPTTWCFLPSTRTKTKAW